MMKGVMRKTVADVRHSCASWLPHEVLCPDFVTEFSEMGTRGALVARDVFASRDARVEAYPETR